MGIFNVFSKKKSLMRCQLRDLIILSKLNTEDKDIKFKHISWKASLYSLKEEELLNIYLNFNQIKDSYPTNQQNRQEYIKELLMLLLIKKRCTKDEIEFIKNKCKILYVDFSKIYQFIEVVIDNINKSSEEYRHWIISYHNNGGVLSDYDKNNYGLMKSAEEYFFIAKKGVDFLNIGFEFEEKSIDPLLLCSAILLDYTKDEQAIGSCHQKYLELLKNEITQLNDPARWFYLFGNASIGMCIEDSFWHSLNSWNLLDFARLKGKMQRCVSPQINNGCPICVFTDSQNNQTWVYYGDIGYLSVEEIAMKKHNLCVVETDSGYYLESMECLNDLLSNYILKRLTIYRELFIRVIISDGNTKDILNKYLYALLIKKQYNLFVEDNLTNLDDLIAVEDLYLEKYTPPKHFNTIINDLTQLLKKDLYS